MAKKKYKKSNQKNIGRKILQDPFFTKKECDRCKGTLENGRTLSMFNMDCICPDCKKAEMKRSDYEEARKASLEEYYKGNHNFEGIGFTY